MDDTQTVVPQELKDKCRQLKIDAIADPFRSPEPSIINAAYHSAQYEGILGRFWYVGDPLNCYYLQLSRVSRDRSPSDNEVRPWLQELFVDGQIQEVTIPNSGIRQFFQGSGVYNKPVSVAEDITEKVVKLADDRGDVLNG